MERKCYKNCFCWLWMNGGGGCRGVEYDSKNVGVHTLFIDEFSLAVAHTPTLPPREREGK